MASVARRVRGHYSLLTRRDRIVLGLMVGFPLLLDLALIWGPAVASFFLSFTDWHGIEPLTKESFVGTLNYEQLLSGSYVFFWPAVEHNIVWLVFLMFVATPIGPKGVGVVLAAFFGSALSVSSARAGATPDKTALNRAAFFRSFLEGGACSLR